MKYNSFFLVKSVHHYPKVYYTVPHYAKVHYTIPVYIVLSWLTIVTKRNV